MRPAHSHPSPGSGARGPTDTQDLVCWLPKDPCGDVALWVALYDLIFNPAIYKAKAD